MAEAISTTVRAEIKVDDFPRAFRRFVETVRRK